MRTPPSILIVDDVAANLESCARACPHTATRSLRRERKESPRRRARHSPDLILLDVMMPEMDGIEVSRRLRADSSIPFIPIVMLTARSESKDVVAALEAGGDEYLTKPVDPGRSWPGSSRCCESRASPHRPRTEPHPRGTRGESSRGARAARPPEALLLAASRTDDRRGRSRRSSEDSSS